MKFNKENEEIPEKLMEKGFKINKIIALDNMMINHQEQSEKRSQTPPSTLNKFQNFPTIQNLKSQNSIQKPPIKSTRIILKSQNIMLKRSNKPDHGRSQSSISIRMNENSSLNEKSYNGINEEKKTKTLNKSNETLQPKD